MKSKIVVILLLWFMGFSPIGALCQNSDFWDGIEAFDGPTDNNPILAAQIDFYFDKMVAPLPDSITLEFSRLIDKIQNNTDLRDFFLWHLLERYQHPEYMTQDQVFVWLYDQYFSQLEIKDLHDNNRAMIQEKAERLRRLALFKPAPDFKIKTSKEESIDLQSVEGEHIVLFFYDHDCDVCHQEMRDLDSICAVYPEISTLKIDMNDDAEGLNGLYAAYDIETTPLIYVLDRDKRIIAKKIRAQQIPFIL